MQVNLNLFGEQLDLGDIFQITKSKVSFRSSSVKLLQYFT